jgi:hypothetical protein
MDAWESLFGKSTALSVDDAWTQVISSGGLGDVSVIITEESDTIIVSEISDSVVIEQITEEIILEEVEG